MHQPVGHGLAPDGDLGGHFVGDHQVANRRQGGEANADQLFALHAPQRRPGPVAVFDEEIDNAASLGVHGAQEEKAFVSALRCKAVRIANFLGLLLAPYQQQRRAHAAQREQAKEPGGRLGAAHVIGGNAAVRRQHFVGRQADHDKQRIRSDLLPCDQAQALVIHPERVVQHARTGRRGKRGAGAQQGLVDFQAAQAGRVQHGIGAANAQVAALAETGFVVKAGQVRGAHIEHHDAVEGAVGGVEAAAEDHGGKAWRDGAMHGADMQRARPVRAVEAETFLCRQIGQRPGARSTADHLAVAVGDGRQTEPGLRERGVRQQRAAIRVRGAAPLPMRLQRLTELIDMTDGQGNALGDGTRQGGRLAEHGLFHAPPVAVDTMKHHGPKNGRQQRAKARPHQDLQQLPWLHEHTPETFGIAVFGHERCGPCHPCSPHGSTAPNNG